MTRMVIHAGFHKTGTTSVQTMLRDNADLLVPHLRVLLRDDFTALTEATRRYSRTPKPLRLGHVHDAATAFFATLDPDDPRPILMSSEDLSGHMPGRHGLTTYSAAPRLMATLARAVRARFGEGLDLTIYFSTRDPDGWLRSAYWQHLRATRLDLSLPDYMVEATLAADLDAVLNAVSAAVKGAAVTALPLAVLRDLPQGPLSPLLDLAEVPPEVRTRIAPQPPVNARPDLGLEPVFLALNRSALHNRDVADIKSCLLRIAQGSTPKG